jgi:cobalt-zinc-cadmium efflux system membrane fusion protein
MRGERVVAALLAFLPSLAWAHGGEDHGEKPAPAATPSAQGPSAGASSEVFEVLVKSPPRLPSDRKLALRVYLARAETNEPVPGAEIELTLTGKTEHKVTAIATELPGIYTATVADVGPEALDVVATVVQGDDTDLLPLGALAAAVAPPPPLLAPVPAPPKWPLFLLAAMGVMASVLAFAWGRSRGRREVQRA